MQALSSVRNISFNSLSLDRSVLLHREIRTVAFKFSEKLDGIL
jgi:hypothetical protein